jgi:hypothetical protein
MQQKSAVEWYAEEYAKYREAPWKYVKKGGKEAILEQAKEMENRMLIDLVQSLKDYTRESHNILGFDEREASEFVEIFKENRLKTE